MYTLKADSVDEHLMTVGEREYALATECSIRSEVRREL